MPTLYIGTPTRIEVISRLVDTYLSSAILQMSGVAATKRRAGDIRNRHPRLGDFMVDLVDILVSADAQQVSSSGT
jgi:hypothetical protein